MKAQNVEHYVLGFLDVLVRLAAKIDPNDVGLVGEQVRQLLDRKAFLDPVRPFPVTKDLHSLIGFTTDRRSLSTVMSPQEDLRHYAPHTAAAGRLDRGDIERQQFAVSLDDVSLIDRKRVKSSARQCDDVTAIICSQRKHVTRKVT